MLSKYKILVLDDHVYCRENTCEALKSAGFQHVSSADSGETAMAMLRSTDYEVVIMGFNLPDMDGMQFINLLANEHMTPMIAFASMHSRKIMNSASLMAKDFGLIVIGSFPKPFDKHSALAIAEKLSERDIHSSNSKASAIDITFDRSELTECIRNGGLQAWFQPKISVLSGQIVGAEALARWENDTLGLLFPSAFMSSIKHHQMERYLLEHVLHEALTAHLSWREYGHVIPVSVNLPTSLLDDVDLPDAMEEITQHHGVPPGSISFELLEDAMPSSTSHFHMGASRLRLKGFGLAQDDFGRGYSSMYNLINIPFTELKIDRAFVTGAASDEDRGAALISAVQLGKQLGLTVTAEGVETDTDLAFLRDIQCDLAQGYLISAATKSSDFSDLLRRALPRGTPVRAV